MHEALFYNTIDDGRVQCTLCPRRCIIANTKLGFCGVRRNLDGKLYCLTYGKVSSACADTIEKKPLYHFFPGSYAYSIGSLGCNMRCRHCQNWHIAHANINASSRETTFIPVEDLIKLTKDTGCKGIAWTYNEPTIWIEYAIDGAKAAKREGLYTVFVTNGFISPDALDAIGPCLDAYRVDLKGFNGKFYPEVAHVKNIQPILDAAIRAKTKWKMHVEVITLVVPGYNDSAEELREIARFIFQNLGKETPWHATRFHPHLDLSQIPPTPVRKLEEARKIGMEEGLQFVYTGNVPGHPGENTYCYRCGKTLIERLGFCANTFEIENGKCRYCKADIPIVGEYGS